MASRRGRDLGVLVGFGLIVVYHGPADVLNNNAGIAEGASTVADPGVDPAGRPRHPSRTGWPPSSTGPRPPGC